MIVGGAVARIGTLAGRRHFEGGAGFWPLVSSNRVSFSASSAVSTRLPTAVQFLATEMRHSGLLSTAYARLAHYFTPFQTFVIAQAERDNHKFTTGEALLVLEREATYKAGTPTPSGLFVYQFEAIARNRLGYDEGLAAVGKDPFYPPVWADYADLVRRQVGVIDFADLVYLRSDSYVLTQRRKNPEYVPPVPPLFGEKEGKIAKANRGRDPLHLFAALQRQLGYPEVPRARAKDDPTSQLLALKTKVKEMEQRMKLLEGEVKGRVDLSEFLARPELLHPPEDDLE